MKILAIAILAVVFYFAASPAFSDAPSSASLPFHLIGPSGQPVAAFQMGAAEGAAFPSMYLNNGDIIGPRNIQCGSNYNPNCDIAAGSTANPGNLNLNWDVGRDTKIYDGHKRILARYDAKHRTIHFYVDVVLHNGAKIRRAK